MDVNFGGADPKAAEAAYNDAKTALGQCARGVNCSTQQSTDARSALATLAAAEADHSINIVVSLGSQGNGPAGTIPRGGGRMDVWIDPGDAAISGTDPTFTTAGLVAHEVTESYGKLTTLGGAASIGQAYSGLHPQSVKFEDAALATRGHPTRTSRSVYGVGCRPTSFGGVLPYGGTPPKDCF